MLQTLFLASTLMVPGGMFNGGGPGPAVANTDMFGSPRVGLSSKGEVLKMWGKPKTEKVEKDHTVCTWVRDRVTYILTFNTRLDVLVDRKVVKS